MWIVIVNEWGFTLYKFVSIRIIGFLFSSTKLEIMMKGITKKKRRKLNVWMGMKMAMRMAIAMVMGWE